MKLEAWRRLRRRSGSRAEHYGAAAQLQCERARAAEAFVAPLLCAWFSDLGGQPGDETEHSIVGPLLRFPL